MKEYASDQIRNVALAGHSGAGKTSLVEMILFNKKITDRLGRVEDGTTVSDYDPEEVRRRCSINTALVPVEHRGVKINFLDLPGYRDFIGEIRNSGRAADALIIVVDAAAGVEPGTELAWELAEEFRLPRLFVVNKMDRERASYAKTLEALRETFDCRLVQANMPVGEASAFKGCVNLLKMQMSSGDGGKVSYADIPADLKADAEALRAALVEVAAEGDDELTMKFLEGETLTPEEILRGLEEDMLALRCVPVVAASALQGPGCVGLLDFVVDCFPPPPHCHPVEAKDPKSGETVELRYKSDEPTAAFVFKTISDPYAGHLTFFKVLSGSVANDTTLLNVGRDTEERVNHLMTVRGKKQDPVGRINAGDIGVLAKLSNTHTNDTLADAKRPLVVPPTPMPPQTVQMAIKAKAKEDEEKIGMAIHRLIEQDPTLSLHRDPAIHQTILSGMGDTHLDVAVSRLKAQSKVEVELEIPRVPYRETITKTAQGQGKHKKQSGGRGQYGDCWLKLEPLPEGSGFQFEWAIVGGVIPTKYMPSVEKGIVQAMERGIIAGCPAVDIKATCYDGSHHSVDSSDMAFQVAASKGFKAVARQANPILLEPIYKVKVTVPEQYMGDVMGDLNSRRGRILGMGAVGRKQVIEAMVPLAEMFEYSKQLRSITQGRGNFEMAYDHYERVPAEIQEKVVAAAAKGAEEEED
ncbi:MAG: elongation factor G [Candidatus Sumerlaeaceae bacterium]|nr:elongation factor G [Candidatus Sumerlaeaceae bacterium]